MIFCSGDRTLTESAHPYNERQPDHQRQLQRWWQADDIKPNQAQEAGGRRAIGVYHQPVTSAPGMKANHMTNDR